LPIKLQGTRHLGTGRLGTTVPAI